MVLLFKEFKIICNGFDSGSLYSIYDEETFDSPCMMLAKKIMAE